MTAKTITSPAQARKYADHSARPAPWLTEPRGTGDVLPERALTNAEVNARLMAKLRPAFLDLLALELMRCTARPNEPTFLCWRSKNRRLESARCDPYFALSEVDPSPPLIVRVVVNKGAVEDVAELARQRGILVEEQDLWRQPRWTFDLAVLPDELLLYAPFVASLVRAHEQQDPSLVVEPPVPTTSFLTEAEVALPDEESAWSDAAWAVAAEYAAMTDVELRRRLGGVPATSRSTPLNEQRRSAER